MQKLKFKTIVRLSSIYYAINYYIINNKITMSRTYCHLLEMFFVSNNIG
jgi:hypothetical protein